MRQVYCKHINHWYIIYFNDTMFSKNSYKIFFKRSVNLKAYRLYLIRHGLTKANEDGRYIGTTDLPLSDEGKEKIISLKENYEYPKVQKVYTSPLARAVQTANLIYPDNYTVNVDSLREYSFGEFENRSIEDLAKDPTYIQWVREGMITPPNGGESKEQFAQRIFSGFNNLLIDMMKEVVTSVAVICHSGIISALLARYGLPRRSPTDWNIKPGEGYCLLTSVQMWTKDQLFEVCDTIPYGKQEYNSASYHNLKLD